MHSHKKGLALLLCGVSLLLAATPAQATDIPAGALLVEAPLSAPAVDGSINGYDWAARDDHTHVSIDALTAGAMITLDAVPATFLDLEVLGLVPDHLYDLVGPNADLRTDYAHPQGNAIFWSIPADPGTWTLVDRTTGQQLLTVIIPGTPDPEDITDPVGRAPCACGNPWSGGRAKQPPRPNPSAPETAMTIEQAAFSFTPLVKAATTTCFDHDIKVDAKISGGMAGYSGTAGGNYFYSHRTCDTIISQGVPVISRQGLRYQKDNYQDGSWKIYATGRTDVGSTLQENIYFGPDGATRYVNAPWKREVSETNAGGVYFGWGAKPYGVDVGVTVSSNGRVETKASIEYLPPDTTVRTIRWKFYSGNQDDTGIIGAAWEV